jgi:hypothetical protein
MFRKNWKKVLAILIVVLIFGKEVYAQQLMTEDLYPEDKRFNIGLNFSGFIPGKAVFEPGYYVGGIVTYDIYRWFAVGVETGYLRCDIKKDSTDLGDFSAAPILADVLIKAPLDMIDFIMVPYFIGGLGVLIGDVDEGSGISGTIETTPSLLMKFGLGLDFVVTESITLYFEGSYMFTKVRFAEHLNGAQTYGLNDADLDSGFIGGGIKLRY